MPFYKKIETEAGLLGIWELTENPDVLSNLFQFSASEKIKFETIKVQRRKNEFLSARLLIEKLLNKKPAIIYNKQGKPFLENTALHISISHSSQLVVALISKTNVGVDVESTERSIEKIATRFLHKNEISHIENNGNKNKTKVIYWSAKEAIFKCSKDQGIQFNEQIYIDPFLVSDEGSFTGNLMTNKGTTKFDLWYFFHKNNVIVSCVKIEK